MSGRMLSDFAALLLFQSRDGSSMADDWDERPRTIEEVKAMLQNRKEAALNRERTLSHAFSQQVLLSSSRFPFKPFSHVICHSFARLSAFNSISTGPIDVENRKEPIVR